VGNEEYARQNDSYGLTTLRNEHVDVNGSTLRLHFRGKGGKEWHVAVRDRRVARVIRRCLDLPDEDLFTYLGDDGELHSITSDDVNEYLREISGQDFTAKDFRTWAGTVLAFLALRDYEACSGVTQAKKHLVQAVKHVAERLGNTPAVCRKCYIHPAVLDCYLEENGRDAVVRCVLSEGSEDETALRPEEEAVLKLLRDREK
jgi:DNA topoisomerase-1